MIINTVENIIGRCLNTGCDVTICVSSCGKNTFLKMYRGLFSNRFCCIKHFDLDITNRLFLKTELFVFHHSANLFGAKSGLGGNLNETEYFSTNNII